MFARIWTCLVSLGLLILAVQTASAQLVYSTSTRGDGDTVVNFTGGSGNWTIPTGVTSVEVLVVGGGGSGGGGVNVGSGYEGGGGGGGVYYDASYAVTGGISVDVAVGAGGAEHRL